MVIDMRKCLAKQEKGGCKDCIVACNRQHNVPDWGDPRIAIKWIWQDKYEHVFPDHPNEFIDEGVKETVPSPVQSLLQPALRPRVPHTGDLQKEVGRYRGNGYAPLYRVPVLHGRVPVWVPKF